MKTKFKKFLNGLSKWLLVAGGINWGLVGLFGFNLVSRIFGSGTITSVIYSLVGLSAIWQVVGMFTKKR